MFEKRAQLRIELLYGKPVKSTDYASILLCPCKRSKMLDVERYENPAFKEGQLVDLRIVKLPQTSIITDMLHIKLLIEKRQPMALRHIFIEQNFGFVESLSPTVPLV